MHRTVRRALYSGLFTAGFLILGAQTATAAENGASLETSGNHGVVSGNQAAIEVEAPVNVTGNSVSILGDSSSETADVGSRTADSGSGEAHTAGQDSAGSGNQALAEVDAPVVVTGNSVSVLGDGSSRSNRATTPRPASSTPRAETSGSDGAAAGNQIGLDADAPVAICGNAVSVAGDATSTACAGEAGSRPAGDGANTDGSHSTAGGNQVIVPASAPVTVGSNAVALLGDASAAGGTSRTGASDSTGSGSATTDGNSSTVGGNQVVTGTTAPVTADDNALALVGDATTDGTGIPAGGREPGTGAATTDGNNSLGGGNQIIAPTVAPVSASSNAVALLGDASAAGGSGRTEGSDSTGSGSATTDGNASSAGGNQLIVPASAPVSARNNAVAVFGDAITTVGTGPGGGTPAGGDTETDGSGSVGGGNQLAVPLTLPLDVRGNAVSVLGNARITNGSDGGAPSPQDPASDAENEAQVADAKQNDRRNDAQVLGVFDTNAGRVAPTGGDVLPNTGLDGWALAALGLGLLLVAAGFLLVRQQRSSD